MTSLLSRFEQFWFRPVSTKGFGLMRIGYGTVGFVSFLLQWYDVRRYFTDAGIIPRSILMEFARGNYRFSLLDFVGDPSLVFLVYLVLLTAFALVIVGVWTRPALIVSVVLLFSFHERATIILAGGDTVMRHIGFILALSPCHRSFSLESAQKRYAAWRKTGKDPGASLATMPIWPYRLLLWQFIILYVASMWTKLLGSMWKDGSAAGIAIHHGHFARFPLAWMDTLALASPAVSLGLLLVQGSWLLFLLLPLLGWLLPPLRASLQRIPWRRAIIAASALMHLSIALLMDVGIFSFIILSGYLGLLLDEDFTAIRSTFTRKGRRTIAVLYDGACGLCLQSVFMLMLIDHGKRLRFVNFRLPLERKKTAPRLTLGALDKALHIKLPDGTFRSGFSAFRTLAWHIPVLWITLPFLYLPGVKPLGDRVYASVAARRATCVHGAC